MSRAEEITSEVRRLVMTCRSLEAQLQQSVPKKTHQEMVTKMQTAIDNLSADLGRTKKSLEETETLGGRLNALTTQISSQADIIANQNKMIESLSAKVTESSVPLKIYSEVKSKAEQYELDILHMVERSEYDSLQTRMKDLEDRFADSIPKAQYAALEIQVADSVPKSTFEELESRLSTMVPRSEFDAASARIQELEILQTSSVPKSAHEEALEHLAERDSEIQSAKSHISELESTVANSVPRDQYDSIQNSMKQMISTEVHAEATAKIAQLQTVVSNSIPRDRYEELQMAFDRTIPKSDFETAKQRIAELESTVSNSVPRASFEELQKAFEQTVPRTELEASRQKIAELEDNLSNSVSKVGFIELHGTLEQAKVDLQNARQENSRLQSALEDSVPKPKFEEIQIALSQSVPKTEFESANAKISELEASLAVTVPVAKYNELEIAMQHMISKEEHDQAISKISELENALSNSIPRSEFDELRSKISLLRDLISGVPDLAQTKTQSQVPNEPTLSTPAQTEPISETPLLDSVTDTPVHSSSVEVVPSVEAGIKEEPTIQESAQTSVVESAATSIPPSAPEGLPDCVPEVQNVTEASEPSLETQQAPTVAPREAETTPSEVREIQSQLSEISGAQETEGKIETDAPEPVMVESERGFKFSNSDFCARSGLEFVEDLEKVDLSIVEQHSTNGDFERWFKEVLSDESSAECLRTVREANLTGEELRVKTIEVIAPKYRH